MNINNSHGELWGIMDSFICIVYDFDDGLIVVNSHMHGAYVIFVHELYYSDTREFFNKWYSDFNISHFTGFDFMMSQRKDM